MSHLVAAYTQSHLVTLVKLGHNQSPAHTWSHPVTASYNYLVTTSHDLTSYPVAFLALVTTSHLVAQSRSQHISSHTQSPSHSIPRQSPNHLVTDHTSYTWSPSHSHTQSQHIPGHNQSPSHTQSQHIPGYNKSPSHYLTWSHYIPGHTHSPSHP